MRPSLNGVESSNQISEHVKEIDATNIDQKIIPLHSILFSSSFDTGLHNTSRSSRMLNTSRSSHEFGIIPRSRDIPQSSHNVGPSNAQQSLEVDIQLELYPQVHIKGIPCRHLNAAPCG